MRSGRERAVSSAPGGDLASQLRLNGRGFEIAKKVLSVLLVVLIVALIESFRRSGSMFPIPFLLLYASVVLAGGAAGMMCGLVAGIIASGYVIFAAVMGFGPRTLTGGELQVLLGVALYVGTGLFLGRVRAQRDQFRRNTHRYETQLESEILARTKSLRENQNALRESEEKFRQMAETISEVFWMIDAKKGEPIYVSPAFEAIWGRKRPPFSELRRVFAEAIHPDDRERMRAAMETLTEGIHDEVYRIVRPDGAIRYIRDRAYPVRDPNGEVYRVVGIAEDITNDRRRETQLRQAQKMESLGVLAGGIAHEINNILLPVTGLTELVMQDVPEGSRAQKNLEGVLQSARHAGALVEKFLSFSRLDEGNRNPVDLRRIVEEGQRLIRSMLQPAVELGVSVGDQPITSRVDDTQIHQVLMNLVSNSKDAIGDRPGRITIDLSTVDLSDPGLQERLGLPAGRYALLTVADTGSGMDADTMAHMFEPFFTTKPVGKGTGMGLATTHGIVASHGGAIDAVSQPGAGARFDVYLPLEGNTPAVSLSDDL